MSEKLKCLQIRSYEITDCAAFFEAIFREQVLPLLKEWHTRIVYAGWSLDGGRLVRADARI